MVLLGQRQVQAGAQVRVWATMEPNLLVNRKFLNLCVTKLGVEDTRGALRVVERKSGIAMLSLDGGDFPDYQFDPDKELKGLKYKEARARVAACISTRQAEALMNCGTYKALERDEVSKQALITAFWEPRLNTTVAARCKEVVCAALAGRVELFTVGSYQHKEGRERFILTPVLPSVRNLLPTLERSRGVAVGKVEWVSDPTPQEIATATLLATAARKIAVTDEGHHVASRAASKKRRVCID